MAHLVPCSSCARHVRSSEGVCPFCGAALEAKSAPRLPASRLGRAAWFVFGAAIAAAPACSEDHEPGDAALSDAGDSDAGDASLTRDASVPDATADADEPDQDANVFPPYGAPPGDGGF